MDLQFLDNTDADDALTELHDPAHYLGFLQVMAHFSNYSWRNVYLIYTQMPHATKLADFDTWKKTYGRSVKQGSTTIKINAPVEQKPKKRFVEKTDPTTGVVMLDDSGKRIMEEIIIVQPPQFKLVRLLDVSQTNGEPLPILAGNVLDNEPLQQAFEDVLKGLCADGVHAGIQSMLTHITVANIDNAGSDNGNFISDSIIYVVCRRFGIDSDFADFDPATVDFIDADTLEIIRKQSNGIISTIEDKFTLLCNERNLDPMTLPKPAEPIHKVEQATVTVVEPPAKAIETPPPVQPATLSQPAQTDPQPLKHLPDPTITIAERNDYGYTRPELLPLTKDHAMALFQRDMTVYALHKNNTEAMAHYVSDIQNHDGIFGIAYGNWQNSREYIALASGNPEAIQEARFVYDGGDSFAVYQIKHDDSPLGYKSYEEIQTKGLDISRQNYNLVYTAALPAPPSDTPEGLFMWVNAELLDDYKGRAMAISDVLSIKKDGAITSHYANGRTFKELLSFVGEEGRKPKIASVTVAGIVGNELQTEPQAETPTIFPTFDISTEVTPPQLPAQPQVQPQTQLDPQSPQASISETPPSDPSEPMPPNELPDNAASIDIYRLSVSEAEKHNAMPAHELSRKVDIACAKVIDEAIQHHKDGTSRYDLATPADVLLEEYGKNRMMWVLAKHMLARPKGFTQDNLTWANDFVNDETGSGDEIPAFAINTHPAVINAFVAQLRDTLNQKRTFSHVMRKAKIKSDAHNNSGS